MLDILKMRDVTLWLSRQEQVLWQQECNSLKILDISQMNQVFFDKKTKLL